MGYKVEGLWLIFILDGPPATPLARAMRILNNQLQAFAAVDERTDALAARLDALAAAK